MWNPHEVLGIDENVTTEHLKKRYKKLCRLYHPDKHDQDKTSLFMFQLIQKSYQSILKSRENSSGSLDVELDESNEKEGKKSDQDFVRFVRANKINTKPEEKNDELSTNLKRKNTQNKQQEHDKSDILKDTNISENDIRVLAQRIKDPWFQPEFSLTEFFGDVSIPDKSSNNNQSTSTTSYLRPKSTRR